MSYFLEAERLGFRHWRENDLPLAVALWTDPEVMGYLGGPMSIAKAEARFRTERDNQQKYGFQYWPIFERATGVHAGCSGLKPFHEAVDVLEVGVHLARPFWGGRHGEEAARAVIAWAWRNTDAEALVAGHFPANEHSRALVGRLGFVYTHHELWEPTATMHPYYRLERRLSRQVQAASVLER